MSRIIEHFTSHWYSGLFVFSLVVITISIYSCSKKAPEIFGKSLIADTEVIHPDWSKNANIYEVNIRQYTPEGTFTAFTEYIPRLKEMGVDILWLMPVNPIGELNRKGSLGSYYAVKDYLAVNPEYGTMDDLKALVSKAHGHSMKVILDWVANHTAWDNVLTVEHPDWYKQDSAGNFVSPFDWSDVIQLDYDNNDLRNYMIEAMKFWIIEADIDGYRCDVAGMVPTEFWDRAREELDKVKAVFMLAEAEKPELVVRAFDMDYGWELHHIMNEIAQGRFGCQHLVRYFQKTDSVFPGNAYRMYFTSNHDENSWKGSEFERMGDAALTFGAFAVAIPGMPLLYSGQEAGLDKRLRFFDKDTIEWGDELPHAVFYKTLLELKHQHKALWNGYYGGLMEKITTTADSVVFAFTREKEGDRIVAIFNFSTVEQEFQMINFPFTGNYTDLFDGEQLKLKRLQSLTLKPLGFRIFGKI